MLIEYWQRVPSRVPTRCVSETAVRLVAETIAKSADRRLEMAAAASAIVSRGFPGELKVSDDQADRLRLETGNAARCIQVIELFAAKHSETFEAWQRLAPTLWQNDVVRPDSIELLAVLACLYESRDKPN